MAGHKPKQKHADKNYIHGYLAFKAVEETKNLENKPMIIRVVKGQEGPYKNWQTGTYRVDDENPLMLREIL